MHQFTGDEGVFSIPDEDSDPEDYDGKHEDHEQMRDWLGQFDPSAFDIQKINTRLTRVRV